LRPIGQLFFPPNSGQRQNKNDGKRPLERQALRGVVGHDDAEVVIRHAIPSFTDGIYEEIIKRYVGTDG
jgi:hypothetical protein